MVVLARSRILGTAWLQPSLRILFTGYANRVISRKKQKALDVMDVREAVAKRLCEIRTSLGLTKSDFAKGAGISQQAYGPFENGKRDISLDAAVKICKAYDASLDYLLLGRGKVSDLSGEGEKEASSGWKREPRISIRIEDSIVHLNACLDDEGLIQLRDKIDHLRSVIS